MNPPGPIPAERLSAWQQHFRAGRLAECAALARALTDEFPHAGNAWQMLGATLLAGNRFADALEPLRRACEFDPRNWSAHENRALALQGVGDARGAAAAYRDALALAPQQASIWSNASNNALQGADAAEALRCANEAIRLRPDLAVAHVAAGNALSALGRSMEAEAAFERALELAPGMPQALLSLGREMTRRRQFARAAELTRAAVAAAPAYAEAHVNLASSLNMLGDIAGAARHYRRAAELRPGMIAARSGELYCMLHDETLTPEQVFAAHARCGADLEAPRKPRASTHANTREPERRLRVGFVSGDLRDHPVARFIEPILRHFDRAAFDVLAYDVGGASDDYSKRLQALPVHWVKATLLGEAALDARIRADAVDILFDLSGHTAHSRLEVFARKPAPLQLSWIGYPGTTGLTAIDYRPVDAISAPPGRLDGQFTEKLLYLPFMTVFERPAQVPDPRPKAPFTPGAPVFGSFNRVNKLGAATLDLWSRVLARVPAARLMIGAVPDEATGDALRSAFAQRGIDGARLTLSPRLDLDAYLRLHDEVDLLLDTLPFSSGTTANFALWMGVPTLTLAGDLLAQRLGASRMAAAGLREFIAESPESFVDIAAHWSQRPGELAQLRHALRERMERVGAEQPVQLVRALERQLRAAWRRWCAGLPPETLP